MHSLHICGCCRLEQEEQTRQKLQLEKVTVDNKLKKFEEELVQHVNISAKVFLHFFFTRFFCMISLYLLFNGHFPGVPGLAGTGMLPFWILLELRVMEVVVPNGAIRPAKLQLYCHHQLTNTHLFYRPDALPVAQPTMSKHQRNFFV